jgi:hypothetical protein
MENCSLRIKKMAQREPREGQTGDEIVPGMREDAGTEAFEGQL